jgi:heat shock protein HslJ
MKALRFFQSGIFMLSLGMACVSCASSPTAPGAYSTSEAGPTCHPSNEQELLCKKLVSVESRGTSEDTGWLKEKPLIVELTNAAGKLALQIKTPCNPLTVPVALQGNVLTADSKEIIAGAAGCLDPEGSYELWTKEYFAEPVAVAVDGKTVTWSNSKGSIVFRGM